MTEHGAPHGSLLRGEVQVAPHEFRPLKRWRNRGRCEACYVHERAHPVMGWTPARHYDDKCLPSSTRAMMGGVE